MINILSIEQKSWIYDYLPDGQKTLVITSCCKKKNEVNLKLKASERYIGQMFRATKNFADNNQYDLLIISAKYGLLKPEDKIDNYNMKIQNKKEALGLRSKVVPKLQKIIENENYSRIIIILGKIYRFIIENLFDERFIILESRNGIFDYLKKLGELNRISKLLT